MADATGLIYLIVDGAEVGRRRRLVPPGRLVEVWQDLAMADHFWLGAESKTLLDATGARLKAKLALDGASVPIFFGPRLCNVESLPTAESLRARVLSAHGVAVAWITLNQLGERTVYEPRSPADPIFFLRRPRGETAHVWRLFRTRQEAIACMPEHYGWDPEALEWAQGLPVEDYEELIERHATAE